MRLRGEAEPHLFDRLGRVPQGRLMRGDHAFTAEVIFAVTGCCHGFTLVVALLVMGR